jgi:Co/Zn/Cd efflux system component
MTILLSVLNSIIPIIVIVLAIILVWKISKTVIHMVIGFIIIGLVLWGAYEVYKVGLDQSVDGAGYLVVFIKGVEMLITRLKDLLL